MDNLVFEESINSEVDSSEFISKKWIYVNDSNSQNYTSQIVIDSTPLSNAGGYINWQEAYILMPLVLQLSCATTANLPANAPSLGDNSCALKNSFIQMINSMNVEFNNQNIIQQTPLTNVFRTFKLMTSYSQNDIVNNGSNYGFYPDTADGWEFKTANSDSGLGLCGNVNGNFGISSRKNFWNYNPLNTVDTQTLINVFTTVTPSVLGGLTNPIMLLPITTGGGGLNNLPDGSYSISLSIFKNNNTGNGQTDAQSALQACRLYAPIYKFNPIAEQRYLSLAPTKKIEYNDIFQYQFNKIGRNEQFNFLVSNGISNIQSVTVIPLLSAGANGTSYNTLLSPFSTTGGTPDPITLTNFNILVSGVNLFLNNELYDFEQFTQQLDESNQLNGNLTTGLTSGLISEADFQNGMRYYYGNCARQLPSEMGVSRSIQIQGLNASLKEINILVFVEFKRSITIDILTGARIE